MMEVIGGSCPHDSTSLQEANPSYLDELDTSIAGKKIGVHYEGIEALNEEGKKLFLESIEQLKAMGADVVNIKMDLLKNSVALYYILATAEASTNLARFDGISFSKRSEKATTLEEVYELSRHDGFGSEVRRRILLGTYILSAGYQDAFYRKAQKVRRLMIEEFQKAFEECDAIVMPTTATSAFKLGSIQDPLQMYLQDLFTLNANLTGMPAVSLPCGFDSSSLPYSIQFIGPQREDARVLRFARQFEKQLGLSQTIPHRYK
jgi:aspartyl-tRNA(Asn)/glutamyl-tRNA(Gln) amidotransferase subunit A